VRYQIVEEYTDRISGAKAKRRTKENTAWILTYMLLVAAFAYMIGWVSGELVCRCKNAEEKVAELYDQLENTCPGTQAGQFKQLRSVLNDVHKHSSPSQKPSKSPPAKPPKINGRISSIWPFHKVWVLKYVPCQRFTSMRLLSSYALLISQNVVTQRHGCLRLHLTKRFTSGV
jgi:hypothetical protein